MLEFLAMVQSKNSLLELFYRFEDGRGRTEFYQALLGVVAASFDLKEKSGILIRKIGYQDLDELISDFFGMLLIKLQLKRPGSEIVWKLVRDCGAAADEFDRQLKWLIWKIIRHRANSLLVRNSYYRSVARELTRAGFINCRDRSNEEALKASRKLIDHFLLKMKTVIITGKITFGSLIIKTLKTVAAEISLEEIGTEINYSLIVSCIDNCYGVKAVDQNDYDEETGAVIRGNLVPKINCSVNVGIFMKANFSPLEIFMMAALYVGFEERCLKVGDLVEIYPETIKKLCGRDRKKSSLYALLDKLRNSRYTEELAAEYDAVAIDQFLENFYKQVIVGSEAGVKQTGTR